MSNPPGGEPPYEDAPPSEAADSNPNDPDHSADKPARSRRRSAVPYGAVIFLVIVGLLIALFAWIRPSWFSASDWNDAPVDLQFQKQLIDLGLVNGVRLSDDTSTSQTFTVATPRDSELTDAVLTLGGTTSASASGTTFLRVLVDGISAYVEELPAGDETLDATIDLPPASFEDGLVQIQVRTTGNLDQGDCNINQELGAFVNLDPYQTHVRGVLTTPLHTVRDVVAGLNHEIAVALVVPPDAPDSQAWFETALQMGTSLTHAGYAVTFEELTPADATADPTTDDAPSSQMLVGPADAVAALGWTSLDDVAGALQIGTIADLPVLAVVQPEGAVVAEVVTTNAVTISDQASDAPARASSASIPPGSVTLASLGTDTSAQQITDTRSWRTSYSLADLPGGTVPTAVHLGITVPQTSDDASWLVNVQLNGQLLRAIQLSDLAGPQTAEVPIPAGLEVMRNQLVITLVRDRDLGGCAVRQTSYTVQLLPETSLTLGGTGTGFTAIPAEFADGFTVDIPASVTADPVPALTGLMPTLAEFTRWQQYPRIAWDGIPGAGPFMYYGSPPPGTAPLVRLDDQRITASGFDLQAFADGLLVVCAQAGSAHGVVVTSVGASATVVPAYGRETARVVGTDGGGFVVSPTGEVVTVPPVRSSTDR